MRRNGPLAVGAERADVKRRQLCIALAAAGGLGLVRASNAAVSSEADAASGIRAALERRAKAAVGLLGRPDGFLGNPKVRIELPGYLKEAARTTTSPARRSTVSSR